jgi:hypothetical protein
VIFSLLDKEAAVISLPLPLRTHTAPIIEYFCAKNQLKLSLASKQAKKTS